MDRVTGRPQDTTATVTVIGHIWNESPNGLTVDEDGQDRVFLRSNIFSVDRDIEVNA